MREEEGRKSGNLSSDLGGAATLDTRWKMKQGRNREETERWVVNED